jgi:hypothetical protein
LSREEFAAAVRCAAATPFLAGEGARGWRASFDWLIANDRNVRKVIEGAYDSAGPRGSAREDPAGGSWIVRCIRKFTWAPDQSRRTVERIRGPKSSSECARVRRRGDRRNRAAGMCARNHGSGNQGNRKQNRAQATRGDAMRKMAAVGKGSVVQWRPRRIAKKSLGSRSVRQGRTERRPELQPSIPGGVHRGLDTELESKASAGVACSFGATRVGVLLERVRLHLGTQRFLAARRGDRIWEVSCDYAELSLERLGARLRPEAFAAELFPAEQQTRAGSRGLRRFRSIAPGVFGRGRPHCVGARGKSPRLKTRATVNRTRSGAAIVRGGR